MHHIHGWIQLRVPENDDIAVDWRLANAEYEEIVNNLKEKIAASSWSDTQCSIQPLNGQYVFVIHGAFDDNGLQLDEIKSVIQKIAINFEDSIGLIYETKNCDSTDNAYKVTVFDRGRVGCRYDPFLTSIE